MKTLRKGMRGHEILDLQARLSVVLGFELEPTGVFDTATERAVMAHQQRSVGPHGQPLAVDGVVGPLTLWSLLVTDQTAAFSTQEHARIGQTRGPLSDMTLAVAIEESRAGAREIGANNSGPFVEKYLRNNGKPGAWCAGFASWCIREAAERLGVTPPPYKLTARGLQRELQPLGKGEDPMGGDLVFWWRVAPDSWQGHVEIVSGFADGILWTIGGNRGAFPAPVRQFSYVLSREEKFLGFARLE